MAVRGYRERRTSIQTATDVKGDAPHNVAFKQLVPQIVRRSRNAVKVDRQELYFFQKVNAGRRCSCFAIEQSPEGRCPVCIGTGFVGGYNKYGCELDILDVTRQNVRTMNIEPDYAARTRPVLFRLIDDALFGFIEYDVEVRSNVRLVDYLQVNSSLTDRRHSRVTASVKLGDVWEPLSDQTISTALAQPRFSVRVTFSRDTVSVESPALSHVAIRYRKLERPRIIADIPRRRESVVLSEFGISDRYEVINFFLADEPRYVGTEDFFVLCHEGTRWKVIDVSKNKPLGILTSHDIMARVVNSYENYYLVPL